MIVRKLLASILFVLCAAGVAQASVDVYISDLNVFASKQFGEFRADLIAHYGVSGSRFDMALKSVDSPGDVAVALWLGQQAEKSLDTVVKQYRTHRGKGWGVVAKNLGIKPGSPAFHRLKRGEIGWYPKNYKEVMKQEKKERAKKKKKNKGY